MTNPGHPESPPGSPGEPHRAGSSSLDGALVESVLQHAGVGDDPAARALLDELWEHLQHDRLPGELDLARAQAIGTDAALAADDAGVVARRLLGLGRALADAATAAGLSGAERARLEQLVDEAAAQAVSAHARTAYERRESWISFLNHEMKNPLNTILNALWLLRERRDASNADRFLDLAERAVKRLEATLKEMRELHNKAAQPVPIKEAAPLTK